MIDVEILDNLNYFRNKYHTDSSTENGIIADNLNVVLPFLAKDVVEVVRCKDCVHSKMMPDITNTEHLACVQIVDGSYWVTRWISDSGYCDWGERR